MKVKLNNLAQKFNHQRLLILKDSLADNAMLASQTSSIMFKVNSGRGNLNSFRVLAYDLFLGTHCNGMIVHVSLAKGDWLA